MDKTLSKTVRTSRLGALAVSAFVLAAGAGGRALAAANTSAAGPLDDAQIARRVQAFNRVEVETADAVKGKLSSPPVWELAQRLAVEDAALDQKLGTLAAANQQSDGAGATGGPADGVDLSKLSGNALEKAYVDREVKAHQTMLAVLDQQLIPSAKSRDLQRELTDVRAETAAHLGHAQHVQHEQKVRELMAHQPDFAWVP